MEATRSARIEKVFKDIHGNLVPMFRWVNYRPMEYYYNKQTDTIDCDCGISVPFHVKDEDINESSVHQALDELEDKVRAEYKKKHNIHLYYED